MMRTISVITDYPNNGLVIISICLLIIIGVFY